MKAKALEAIGNLDLREIAQIEAARGDERTPRTRVGGGRAPARFHPRCQKRSGSRCREG
jgi:hypothetical protein